MIARAEAGAPGESMTISRRRKSRATSANSTSPSAEDRGLALGGRTSNRDLMLHGSRELIGQALANLVDNALKYGVPSPCAAPIARRAEASVSDRV